MDFLAREFKHHDKLFRGFVEDDSIEKDGKDKKKPAAIVLNGEQNGGPMKITAVVTDKENDKLEQTESVVMKYYHDNYYLYADKYKVALKPLVNTPNAGGNFTDQYTPKGQDFFIISETNVYIVLIFEEGQEAFVTPRTKEELEKLKKEHSDIVFLFLNVFKTSGPDIGKLALYYPVNTKTNTRFNCYLKPNIETLSIDIAAHDVTHLTHEQEDDLSRSHLYFTNNPVKPVQKGVTEVDGDETEPFMLADPPSHKN